MLGSEAWFSKFLLQKNKKEKDKEKKKKRSRREQLLEKFAAAPIDSFEVPVSPLHSQHKQVMS